LGSGDTEGGAVIVCSLDVCPTASRSANTPMSQAAAATRERSANTAKRIVNPRRTPTMAPPLADTDAAIVAVPAGAPRARSQYAKDTLTSVGEAEACWKARSAVLQRKYGHVAYLRRPGKRGKEVREDRPNAVTLITLRPR
jgi:hypothetical protein